MEQSVNNFNKGMLSDTHPMVLSNETLTDALNATFVTMNGNEVILQNDMGNRKIDNAFLPEGYEPVGIKEYGGIIYVATYNPLTNRGQIGSFPSPQRKIDTSKESGILNFGEFIEMNNGDYEIIKNSITIPISGTNVLHTGDKFSIYSDDINNLIKYIIKENNKNNLFTFLIGIFNSQNEFIDISDKLRLERISENYDYYIIEDYNENENLAINDSELLRLRNSLAINTYSYKMSSPLYLRAILNQIDNISYSMTGEIDSNKNIKLKIKTTYLYNCYDNINISGNSLDSFKLEFSSGDIMSFDGTLGQHTKIISPTEDNITPIYNEELDKYLVTLTYIVNCTSNGNIINYKIKFPLLFDDTFSPFTGKTIYQKHLQLEGTLNTLKFGSDNVDLKSYRYFYNKENNTTTFDVEIDSYPKESSKYLVIPVIYDKNNLYVLELDPISDETPGSGNYSIIFNHSLLDERERYYIKLIKKLEGEDDVNITAPNSPDNPYMLYITTPLFNGNYIGEQNSIENLGGNISYDYESMSNVYIDNFLRIKEIYLPPKIDYSINLTTSAIEKNIEGDLLYPIDGNETEGEYHIKDTYTITSNISFSAEVNNKELYPKETDNVLEVSVNSSNINPERYINETKITKNNNNKYLYSENLREILGTYNKENLSDVITIESNVSTTSVTSTVCIDNSIYGWLLDKEFYSPYVISSLYDFIKDRYFDNTLEYYSVSLPYMTIDNEGATQVSVLFDKTGKKIDMTREDYEGNPDRILIGRDKNLLLYLISQNILDNCENYLISEYNSNDVVYGYPTNMGEFFALPKCVNLSKMSYGRIGGSHMIGEDLSGHGLGKPGYKRIWLKINEKEYTPLYTEVGGLSDNNLESEVFKDTNNSFLKLLATIPHYYLYKLGGILFSKKIIQYNQLIKTKEFDIPTELKYDLELNVSSNLLSDIFKGNYDSINKEINILEKNLISNEDFIEKAGLLLDFKLNCVLSRPKYSVLEYPYFYFTIRDNNSESQEDYIKREERIIEYLDSNGESFDPTFVYYENYIDANYNFINSYSSITQSNSLFTKSYKANKFYVSDLKLEMPELLDSSKLYLSKTGKPHPYISEYAVPDKFERKYMKENDKIRFLQDNLPYTGCLYEIFRTFANPIIRYMEDIDVPYTYFPIPALGDDTNCVEMYNQHKVDVYATMLQYEYSERYIGNRFAFVYIPLKVKNIFNYYKILAFHYFNWEQDNESSDDFPFKYGWKSADELLNNS